MLIKIFKKLKEQKIVIKRILQFKDYKNCLFKNEILKSQQIFKSEAHCVYNVKVNKIALISNEDKRI